jgi:hypothetical protein
MMQHDKVDNALRLFAASAFLLARRASHLTGGHPGGLSDADQLLSPAGARPEGYVGTFVRSGFSRART